METKNINLANDGVIAVIDDNLVRNVLRKQTSKLIQKNGRLRPSYYSYLCEEISKRVNGFILDCCNRVVEDIGITERNLKAHLADHWYELCWKNDANGNKEFEVVNILTNIEDAKAIINARKMSKTELYKIAEVKDGVEISVDYSTQNYSPTGIGEDF